jgi:ketosteroid isomerase-like protein
MRASQIRAVLKRRLEAMGRLDARAVAADYADDCVLETAAAGTVIGRAATEQAFQRWFAAFPDSTFQEEQETLISSDRAVQFLRIRGTDSVGGVGRPPSGRTFDIFVAWLCTFRDGQIAHERAISDFGGWLLQLAGESRASGEGRGLYRTILDRAFLAHEISVAATIQQALMPAPHHVGVDFEIASASVPCRAIGGDFVDYFDLPAGVFGFALGDVTGKGPPAALLAAELQGAIAAHADPSNTTSGTVARANLLLTRRPIDSRFATMLYGTLSPGGQLTYCNAGHNPPFLVGREQIRRLDTGGMILGAFSKAAFEEETIQLRSGDVIVVFSDGITEALDREGTEFGDERLLSCILANQYLAPADLLKCVIDSVRAFCGDVSQSDDLTLLVLRYGNLPASVDTQEPATDGPVSP